MIIKGIFMLFTLFALSSDVRFFVLSHGLTAKASLQSVVIKDKEELKRVWVKLGIVDEIPTIDFKKEVVIVLTPSGKKRGFIEISNVQRKANDVEVRFVVKPLAAVYKTQASQQFPYLVAKLYPLDAEKVKVKVYEDVPRPPIPADTAIGQGSYYTNVLKESRNVKTPQFFPLDKGSVWTYRIESKGNTHEETYSVRSISQDGWSVFDNFFGQQRIAMRVDSSGDIFVSSEKGMQPLYNTEIQTSFKKSEFLTPAGKFDDLMIVTIPRTDKFWFEDIYAKGVGLIYHEHKSPKGVAKYTLVKAHVRGKDYPSH
jgi:hypothetical protein